MLAVANIQQLLASQIISLLIFCISIFFECYTTPSHNISSTYRILISLLTLWGLHVSKLWVI